MQMVRDTHTVRVAYPVPGTGLRQSGCPLRRNQHAGLEGGKGAGPADVLRPAPCTSDDRVRTP
ncbi:hypothetical protein TPA0906_74050 [Streptomyces olivaceus]|nr:hypothetical protein TPA0906_74050 [Streptomyces olivaceus]